MAWPGASGGSLWIRASSAALTSRRVSGLPYLGIHRSNQRKPASPAILVLRDGHNHARLIDGRHRFEAMAKLGRPLRAYVGYLDAANEKAAYDTYLHQIHSGDSPQNKGAGMQAFQDRGEPVRRRDGGDGR